MKEELRDEMTSTSELLTRFECGEISAQVVLMELLIALEDARAVDVFLETHRVSRSSPLGTLWQENRAQCDQLAKSLRDQAAPLASGDAQAAVARVRDLFETLIRQSEEASVALYSLGNPTILAKATEELVAFLDAQRLTGPQARVLDIGCGIGRMEQALAARVAHIHGIDISPAMIEAARRRCAGLSNVQLSLSSGSDLAQIASGSCSLVLGIDTFPYLVEAGHGLVQRLFAEVRRVLSPAGRLLVFNYSYRDDLDLDRRDVAGLGLAHGLTPHALGTAPLTLWNARLFSLQRTA